MTKTKFSSNSLLRAFCAAIILFPAGLQAATRRQAAQEPPIFDRPPAVAGQFYPANKEKLAETVDGLFLKAQRHPIDGELRALLVPHAGYDYSGLVAADAYKSMSPGWKTFVIIGPSHHQDVPTAAVYARGSFVTPLGKVPVDEELASQLLTKNRKLFTDSAEAHAEEHSIEVQLPFLQRVFSDFKILPILMTTDDPNQAMRVGDAVARAIVGKNALIIISSDLSQYPAVATGKKCDMTLLRAMQRVDPSYIFTTHQWIMSRNEPDLETSACGISALVAGMEAARALGADSAETWKYVNSGEDADESDRAVPTPQPATTAASTPTIPSAAQTSTATVAGNTPSQSTATLSAEDVINNLLAQSTASAAGDSAATSSEKISMKSGNGLTIIDDEPPPATVHKSMKGRAVGYAAVAFTHTGRPPKPQELLDEAHRQKLFDAAHQILSDAFNRVMYAYAPLSDDPVMNMPTAVFVTMWVNGQLHGCIGSEEPRLGLLDAIRYYARKDAFLNDGQIKPVQQSELPAVRFQIAILSPPNEVRTPDEVVPNRDGVIVKKDEKSGLFLPEVWAQLPKKEDFFSELCSKKAGLKPDCWVDNDLKDVHFYVFQTDPFREKD